MRKLLAVALVAMLFQTAAMAQAADIGFSINVGGPPIVISQPPDFLYPSELGFGVAVGVPYDMFYVAGVYYVYRGGGWYRASYYGDNWIKIRKGGLPPELRRYKITQIHQFRDRDYRVYGRDRDHYRGQHFRPEVKGREEHHEMKNRGHEEKQDLRERHPEERGGERREQGHER